MDRSIYSIFIGDIGNCCVYHKHLLIMPSVTCKSLLLSWIYLFFFFFNGLNCSKRPQLLQLLLRVFCLFFFVGGGVLGEFFLCSIFTFCPVRGFFKRASFLMLNMPLRLMEESSSALTSPNGKMRQAHFAFVCPHILCQPLSEKPWFL